MTRIAKLLKRNSLYSGQKFREPPLFVPADCVVPETANVMAKQLYQAGIITRDDYEKMLGVRYDIDLAKNDVEDFDDEAQGFYQDEFKLSTLAEYYSEPEPEPDPKPDPKPDPTDPDPAGAKNAPPANDPEPDPPSIRSGEANVHSGNSGGATE